MVLIRYVGKYADRLADIMAEKDYYLTSGGDMVYGLGGKP